jgi:hypothetical protein
LRATDQVGLPPFRLAQDQLRRLALLDDHRGTAVRIDHVGAQLSRHDVRAILRAPPGG